MTRFDRPLSRLQRGGLALLTLAPLLAACAHTNPADDPQHDFRTEARREQDCADTAWKAANLGLWYNLCQTNTY